MAMRPAGASAGLAALRPGGARGGGGGQGEGGEEGPDRSAWGWAKGSKGAKLGTFAKKKGLTWLKSDEDHVPEDPWRRQQQAEEAHRRGRGRRPPPPGPPSAARPAPPPPRAGGGGSSSSSSASSFPPSGRSPPGPPPRPLPADGGFRGPGPEADRYGPAGDRPYSRERSWRDPGPRGRGGGGDDFSRSPPHGRGFRAGPRRSFEGGGHHHGRNTELKPSPVKHMFSTGVVILQRKDANGKAAKPGGGPVFSPQQPKVGAPSLGADDGAGPRPAAGLKAGATWADEAEP